MGCVQHDCTHRPPHANDCRSNWEAHVRERPGEPRSGHRCIWASGPTGCNWLACCARVCRISWACASAIGAWWWVRESVWTLLRVLSRQIHAPGSLKAGSLMSDVRRVGDWGLPPGRRLCDPAGPGGHGPRGGDVMTGGLAGAWWLATAVSARTYGTSQGNVRKSCAHI